MNRLPGFQGQRPDRVGRPQPTKTGAIACEISYDEGGTTHARIGFVEGLAIALVEDGKPYQRVLQDLMACRTRHQIPSGILLFTQRHSSALSDEDLDQLASQAVSVADAGRQNAKDFQIKLLHAFAQRQAQAMSVFKPT